MPVCYSSGKYQKALIQRDAITMLIILVIHNSQNLKTIMPNEWTNEKWST